MYSDGIKKLFEQFNIEEEQQVNNLMNGNSDALPLCSFDIITCKFIDKDKLMIEELIPEIQSLLKDESFQNRIVQLEKNKAKEELKIITNKLNTRNDNEEEKQKTLIFYRLKEKQYIDKIKNLDFEKFISGCEELFNSLLDLYKNDSEFYQKHHIYLCVAQILFEDYKRDEARKNRFNIPKNNSLEKLYQENHGSSSLITK